MRQETTGITSAAGIVELHAHTSNCSHSPCCKLKDLLGRGHRGHWSIFLQPVHPEQLADLFKGKRSLHMCFLVETVDVPFNVEGACWFE